MHKSALLRSTLREYGRLVPPFNQNSLGESAFPGTSPPKFLPINA